VTATSWTAFEATRHAAPTRAGVRVASRTRMAFEKAAVLWEFDVSAPAAAAGGGGGAAVPFVNVTVAWAASALAFGGPRATSGWTRRGR
jgi:hypothetical protein